MSELWHGTPGGYANHGCRCVRCRVAHTDADRDYRARCRAALEAGRVAVVHGEYDTYLRFGCRCAECREARRLAGIADRRKARTRT